MARRKIPDRARNFRDARTTEQRNPRTADIDVASSEEIVDFLHEENRLVADAVHEARDAIAKTIDLALAAFRSGGRLIYVGAGTSGRLAVMDAAECPPTFGTRPHRVVGIIAGGPAALIRSQEGAEDDEDGGRSAIEDHRVGAADLVVGVTASGSTPFVAAALALARERGARTALLACSEPPEDATTDLDALILVQVGPEALTGSTRLKAGTATKMVLNAISTGAMIRRGKAYGNLMVDLTATSEKLVDRGQRIVMEASGVNRGAARRAIADAGGSVKVAIVMTRLGVGVEEARQRLAEAGGFTRGVAGDPPSVTP